MGNEDVDLVTVAKPVNKKSLLERYDIPIEHLSYEYINQSANIKELERIVVILRSGEEGVYPDLTKHAEERLASIKPESTVLRIAEPVLTKNMLTPEIRKNLENDMNEWMNEMKLREKDLEEGRTIQITEPIPQPEIRQISFNEQKKKHQSSKNQDNSKRISACDYAAWDKYDADTELNRIDLRCEKKQAEIKRTQKKQREKEEKVKKAPREAIIKKLTLTGTEYNVMAEEERKKGNEAFKAGDYEEALQLYDLSIAIDATSQAYNNRAITCIKLQRYNDAINDCNRVISADHMNIKALLRRGLALEHLEKKAQALADYEAVLKSEPMNKVAIAAIKKLRAPCHSRKIKMKIEEEPATEEISMRKVSKNEKIVREILGPEKSKQDSYTNGDFAYKSVTLPHRNSASSKQTSNSQVCFCNNAPSSSQHTSPLPHMRNIYCSEKFEKSVKLPRHQSIFTKTGPSFDKSSGVIIEEIPNEQCEKPVEKSCTKECQARPKKLEERNAKKSGSEIEEFPKKITTPYEFIKLWHSLKNDTELILRARLLQSFTPENIDTGNKIDGDMLCIILRCFERHFCVPEHSTLLLRFLQSLTKVKRFSMICMFMDEKDKKVLHNVFSFLKAQGSAREDIQDLCKAYTISM